MLYVSSFLSLPLHNFDTGSIAIVRFFFRANSLHAATIPGCSQSLSNKLSPSENGNPSKGKTHPEVTFSVNAILLGCIEQISAITFFVVITSFVMYGQTLFVNGPNF